MYKFKSYNYYNNLLLNYNLLYLDYLIKLNSFIIFFNINQISNQLLLRIKILIQKQESISLILNNNTSKIFLSYFKFLSCNIFSIFVNNYTKFFEIIKILNNINFFYSYKKRFSNIITNNIMLKQMNYYKNFTSLHYIIFKILFNIIIILLYFILCLLKYLN